MPAYRLLITFTAHDGERVCRFQGPGGKYATPYTYHTSTDAHAAWLEARQALQMAADAGSLSDLDVTIWPVEV